jgi:hypothetical protein
MDQSKINMRSKEETHSFLDVVNALGGAVRVEVEK